MWVSKYFVFFVVYSFMGWLYESMYCTIKGGKWENRGFLYGPICPIYGAGAVALTAIDDYLHYINFQYEWWQVVLVSMLGSMVLEYTTSWVLEKLFHAYWWDYSDIPFNINGRICLPCTLGFGGAGLVVAYGIAPFTRSVLGHIGPVGMEFVSLVFMGIVAIDTALTVSALSNFARTVEGLQEALNKHMDQFVTSVQGKAQAAGNLISEEKERFSRENMEQALTTMGSTYRAAVKRVKGFKRAPEGGQLQRTFDAIKKRVRR
ncbi:MAG: putative ABC transporter permease [Agathobacter sp.]|nr:putative ABC transporter permease [Agathobacter sp.]